VKKSLYILILMSMSIFNVSAKASIDDWGNPNSPQDNERANACYDGASMEGKCDTEWAWVCGWYIIRFDDGIYTNEQVPAACTSLITTHTPVPALPPGGGCQQYDIAGFYVDFGSGYFLASGHPASTIDSTCTILNATHHLNIVYAPAGTNALSRCNDHGTYTNAILLYGDVYRCLL
jgi:hypothetical protein